MLYKLLYTCDFALKMEEFSGFNPPALSSSLLSEHVNDLGSVSYRDPYVTGLGNRNNGL